MPDKNKISDQWRTPDSLYQELNNEFDFQIDLCATKENSKCENWYQDYLNNECWHVKHQEPCYLRLGVDWLKDSTAFMNCPYSNPKPFIEKAWEDSRFCKIVCLVKVDPSTQWWGTFWDYNTNCWNCSNEITRYLYRSMRYCNKENKRPMCLVCMDSKRYNGPKEGCEQPRYFPKRIQFDPPIELINSGDVWNPKCKHCTDGIKLYDNHEDRYEANESQGYVCSQCEGKGRSNKWVQKCKECKGLGYCPYYFQAYNDKTLKCRDCNGKGHKPLSGPSFSCALLIFDRRVL